MTYIDDADTFIDMSCMCYLFIERIHTRFSLMCNLSLNCSDRLWKSVNKKGRRRVERRGGKSNFLSHGMSPFKPRGSREQTLHEIAAFFFTTCPCLWISDPCRREQHRNTAYYSEIQVNLELLPRHLARGAGKSKWPGNGWIHSLGMFLLLSSWTIAATGTFHVSMGASLFSSSVAPSVSCAFHIILLFDNFIL